MTEKQNPSVIGKAKEFLPNSSVTAQFEQIGLSCQTCVIIFVVALIHAEALHLSAFK